MKKLKSDMESKAFEPVYLLYGPEAFLRRGWKNSLRKAVCGDDTMNYTYREGREADMTEIRDIAETMPFFADRRLIVLENTGWLKKGGEALAEYIPALPETTVLLLVDEEVDKRSKLFKAVDKCGHAVECARLNEGELRTFAKRAFVQAKMSLEPEALDLFLERCGDDLDRISGEQEKLIAYCRGRRVTRRDVEVVTSITAQNRVFDMLDAMSLGRPKEAWQLYEDLRALREPPMRILFLMTQQVNRLLQVKELDNNGLRSEAIAEQTGIRSFAVKRYLRQAQSFTQAQLRSRLEKMAEYDYAIKTGNLDDALAVEMVLAEFAGRYDL